MKKLLTVVAASLAFAAMADYVAPQIGVTTITATSKNTVIPVPFLSLTNGTSAISAAHLVKTTNLKAGTWMLAVAENAYSAWTLESNGGTWTPASVATADLGITATAAAADATLTAGSAIWIVLPTAEETAITVYGAYSPNVTSTIAADTESSVATLIANPLQGQASFTIKDAVAGDQIFILAGDTADRYVCATRKSNSTLVWSINGAAVGALPTLAMGQGMWYVRAANAEAANISWTLANENE